MAWKESHKLQTRERILTAAARLFTQKGFDQVGINDVMQAANLTRGAFYAHFSSKIELYEEAIISAGKAAEIHFGKHPASVEQLITEYLSQQHLCSTDIRCPLPCLISDIAHADEQVRKIYTKIYKKFSSHLDKLTQGKNNSETILLQTVLLIGGMAVARSVSDENLATTILSVCSKAARKIALDE